MTRKLVPETVTAIRLWRTAVTLGVFTCHDLSAATQFSHDRTGDYIKDWERQRLLKKLDERGAKNRANFQVIADGKLPRGMDIDASLERIESHHGNMWTAMRALRSFTAMDIAATAGTLTIHITEDDAARYCRMLAKGSAPYLKPIRKAVPGKANAQYRLVRNTGPLPPKEKSIRATFDPNLSEFTYLPGVDA